MTCFSDYPIVSLPGPILGNISCGQTIFGGISVSKYSQSYQYYQLDLDQDYIVSLELCITKYQGKLSIVNANLKRVVSDNYFFGVTDADDCEAIYFDKLMVDTEPRPLSSSNKYFIEIINTYKNEEFESDGRYKLTVICRPTDAYRVLSTLPLSSFSWSDAFDIPECQNPVEKLWCAANVYNSSSYVEADLNGIFEIYAVLILNASFYFPNEWIISCNLEYSMEGIEYDSYIGNPLTEIFDNYAGRDYIFDLDWNILIEPITAKYIRFVPVEYHNAKTMQVEILGKSLVLVVNLIRILFLHLDANI